MPSRPYRLIVAALIQAIALRALAAMPAAEPAQFPDRTTPLLKAMTADEAYYAHRFVTVSRRKVRILDGATSSSHVGAPDDFFVDPSEPTPKTDLMSGLHAMACHANSEFFLGKVETSRALPTEDGAFLFTIYGLRVIEVFNVPSGARLQAGDLAELARAGGEITIDGKSVQATLEGYPRLAVGESYIVFAGHYEGYSILEGFGEYTLNGSMVTVPGAKVGDPRLAAGGIGLDEFRSVLRAAIAAPCSK